MVPGRLADCQAGLTGGPSAFLRPGLLMKVRKAHGLDERLGVGAQSEGGHPGPPLENK